MARIFSSPNPSSTGPGAREVEALLQFAICIKPPARRPLVIYLKSWRIYISTQARARKCVSYLRAGELKLNACLNSEFLGEILRCASRRMGAVACDELLVEMSQPPPAADRRSLKAAFRTCQTLKGTSKSLTLLARRKRNVNVNEQMNSGGPLGLA